MHLRNKLGWLGIVPCMALALLTLAGHLSAGPGTIGERPLVWLATAISGFFAPAPSAVRAGTDRLVLAHYLYVAASLSLLPLFAAAYWRRTDPGRVRSLAEDRALLVAQLLLSMVDYLEFTYFIALEVGVVLPLRAALRWLVAIALAGLAVRLAVVVFGDITHYTTTARVMTVAASMVVMQCMAVGVGQLIVAERRAREALAVAHARLLATQALMEDLVRGSERLRIARDLHDAIGHHLTALKLHLDLAARRAPVQEESLVLAQGLARDLLSEVRVVVGTERQRQSIDLRHALATLCEGIPEPRMVLDMAPDVVVESPAAAQTLFHAVQEAVTNAVRHARATRVAVTVRRENGMLIASVADDGRGKAENAPAGHGLRGIAERLAGVGGTLIEHRPAEGGFRLEITLPDAGRLVA